MIRFIVVGFQGPEEFPADLPWHFKLKQCRIKLAFVHEIIYLNTK
jgi:hypothetical protein